MLFYCLLYLFFFFKQKTAYEMRISDWSSDVCSSDLVLQYRALGRSRRYTIGLHGVWTAESARQEAKVQLGRVAQGDNPAEERQIDHKAITVKIGRASCRDRGCKYV